MTSNHKRPVFLDLTKIEMPVGALTSIGHRISGVLLALSVPTAVYLFGTSLQDEQGFSRVTSLFGKSPVKAVIVIVVWALAHHLLDGVRHVLTDFDVGSPLRVAQRTAWLVNVAGIAIALMAGWVVW